MASIYSPERWRKSEPDYEVGPVEPEVLATVFRDDMRRAMMDTRRTALLTKDAMDVTEVLLQYSARLVQLYPQSADIISTIMKAYLIRLCNEIAYKRR